VGNEEETNDANLHQPVASPMCRDCNHPHTTAFSGFKDEFSVQMIRIARMCVIIFSTAGRLSFGIFLSFKFDFVVSR
jgi:hypothetical protein